MADDTGRPRRLRSAAWFDAPGREGILHRSWVKNQGIPDDAFDGRPVIGICNTFSELAPCNAHFRTLAERVKRGVWEAGGFPLEFPTMSLGELARIVRRDHQTIAGPQHQGAVHHAASAARWSWVSSPMPFSASPISASSSARENGCCSAVPWISTNLPDPVSTKFASVCASTSSR